ncbi:hypothetical protein CYR55_18435 [Chimaeribacter californicus]|uniref:DUF943 domain-containing protein n=1 Tax=Chimaeribacter californicus TaxID=2060067 RepID=A0A2N5DYC5_9GAMM|nr:DUF943 family protein [Chimaeribacter californicus]PLR32565.1 hypothetical protein CYR55_18435 [Chimaeribacter californicus]
MLKNKILSALLLIGFLFSLWWLLRPVEIDAVHRDGAKGLSVVLVKNFPLTDKGALSWWKKNSSYLKDNYNVPDPNEEGEYRIYFLKWNGIYKEMPDTDQGSDLRCFSDMPSPKNCIDKEGIMLSIARFDGGKIKIETRHGNTYLQLSEKSGLKRVK